MFPQNVRVKLEPGTSSKIQNMLLDQIKVEPGSSERLPSLKMPRDLKLTSKPTKFKPNLVERKKKTDVPTPIQNRDHRGHGRGRGGERGKNFQQGRGRGGRYIQSQSIFSEGINEVEKSRATRIRESHSDAVRLMERPIYKRNVNENVDKESEDVVVKELYDDHIDHEVKENRILPIELPIRNNEMKMSQVDLQTLIKSEDKKAMQNGNKNKKLFDLEEKLILFQFPDTLPGIGKVADEPKSHHTNNNSNNVNKTENVSEEAETEIDGRCTLQDINEGLLGKMIVYKSGKTRLVIGKSIFDIELGPDPGFLQDVISVPITASTNTGNMINLGPLTGNIIVTPSWDELFKRS